jgi:hypothetical protein
VTQQDSKITKGRRGVPRYLTNPSLSDVQTKTGTRRVSNRSNKDSALIISTEGEFLGAAQFYDIYEVDKTQFIKLYVQGIKALQGLTSAGTKVFEMLYYEMQKRPNADKIYLHFATVQANGDTMSLATFKRGMNELIAKEFLYESTEPFFYFVNINYVFNGDRLSFVKEYRRKN